jgi:hypothetical protein
MMLHVGFWSYPLPDNLFAVGTRPGLCSPPVADDVLHKWTCGIAPCFPHRESPLDMHTTNHIGSSVCSHCYIPMMHAQQASCLASRGLRTIRDGGSKYGVFSN